MKQRRYFAVVSKIVAISILGSMAACEFKDTLTPIPWPEEPEQRFRGFSIEPGDDQESPEEGVQRLFNEMFDPFNLPGDLPYEGSIYEEMDKILGGAYEYYDYDLDDIAARGQNNPLTEQKMWDYLVETDQLFAEDPATGEEFDTYVWFQRRLGAAAAGPIGFVLNKIGSIDTSNPLNYEANYVSAMFRKNGHWELIARDEYRYWLGYYYGKDPAGVYEYLSDLDLFMGSGTD